MKSLPVPLLILLTLAISSPQVHAAPAGTPSSFVKAAYARQRVVPLVVLRAGSVKVDGDLTEWGSFAEQSGVIDGVLDHTSGPINGSVRPAAAFKFARDDGALYFAVHVVDPSIVTGRKDIAAGDAVEVFIDLRPIEPASGPKLGDSPLTAGTCHLVIAAPSGDGPLRYTADTHSGAPIGPFDLAGRRTDDGYAIEIRLPYTSLPELTAERLTQPFGFDVSIDDVDAAPMNGMVSRQWTYAWSDTTRAGSDASVYGVVDTGLTPSIPNPLISTLPAYNTDRQAMGFTHRGGILIVGAVAPIGTPVARVTSVVHYIHEHRNGSLSPVALLSPHQESTPYPALGVLIHRQWWSLAPLATGRYVARTEYPQTGLVQITRYSTVLGGSFQTSAGAPSPGAILANRRLSDGRLVLPNGWRIRPAGTAIALPGDMPQRIIATADGRYLLVSTSGYHDQGVYVVDLARRKVVQGLPVQQTFGGLCLNSSQSVLYASAGHVGLGLHPKAGASFKNAVLCYAWSGGKLKPLGDVSFPAGADTDCFVAGLAQRGDGSLYVVNINADRIYRLQGNSLPVAAAASLPYHPFDVTLSPDGKTLAVSDWGDQSVTLLDPATLAKTASYRVGSHPIALAYAPDGRLFVVCSGSNCVSVIAGGQVTETIKTSLDPRDLVGSTPDALAISKDGKRLYVANADNNDIAVVDISDPTESKVLGFIPTGWYPSALAISEDGKKLYVGVGKGMHSSANPDHAYIATLLNGAVCVVNVPSPQKLAQYTREVVSNLPPAPSTAAKSGYSNAQIVATLHKIKHVIYIIRENRTYDQVLGDLGRGNGDPSLTMFGEQVTPNAHTLAREYVTLDNLYCNGEVTEDGHQWCDAAYATDFNERVWVNGYGGRDEPQADDRLKDSPAGYLWDNCARHGVTFFSYGEASRFIASPDAPPQYTGEGSLKGHMNQEYGLKVWSSRDTELARIFLTDFHAAQKSGVWPQFVVMGMPEDHTHGFSTASYTPQACVASNDQAIGQIVDAVSHSRFWKDTAIFIIEDDAQNGADHVDAHRTVGLVISPYVRRNIVDSTLYTTASFVRTMEIILGLPPMTQFDERATPLYNAFMPSPELAAYRDLPPRIDLMAKNPNGRAALESAKLDFSGPDRVDPDTYNRLLWQVLKPGVPMPAPVRRAQLASR